MERGSVYFQFADSVEPGVWSYTVTALASASLSLSCLARPGPAAAPVTAAVWAAVEAADSPGRVWAELRAGQVRHCVSTAETAAAPRLCK